MYRSVGSLIKCVSRHSSAEQSRALQASSEKPSHGFSFLSCVLDVRMSDSLGYVLTLSDLVLLPSNKLPEPGWEAADCNGTLAVQPCWAKDSWVEAPKLLLIYADIYNHLKCGPENNIAVLACLQASAKEDYLWSCYTASISGLTFFPFAWGLWALLYWSWSKIPFHSKSTTLQNSSAEEHKFT